MRRRIMEILYGFVIGIAMASLIILAVWAGYSMARVIIIAESVEATPAETPRRLQAARSQRIDARAKELAARRERFEPEQEVAINMGAIISIESSGNPLAVSPVGCRGLCQIAEGTWGECAERMGVTWTWKDDAFDPGCNRAVGHYYINSRIPQMLDHYGIDDSIATRIGAYNAGIGNLCRLWNEYDQNWLTYAPTETQDYLRKYIAILSRQNQQ
ncbi:MAG: transglycosylase SLT domain-containing protein [Planctomycetota bacterium]|nr:transglycosylase SLT domain-containing protein [Planctomycetota bacterium]